MPKQKPDVTPTAIAVSVITGFLGSGKTTLLNYLLRHPDMGETAVLINELGEVSLDHLLVDELGDDVVLLESGCICCTVKGALVDSLKSLYVKRLTGQVPPFHRLVIETTGLADPIPIVDCLMRDPLFKHAYRLETIVTTVDAVYGMRQLDAHAEAVRQAAVADRIVVSKIDLSNPGARSSLVGRLTDLNPTATIIPAVRGEVPPARLFDLHFYDPATKSDDVRRWLHGEAHVQAHYHAHAHGHEHDADGVNRHDDRIRAFSITLDRPVRWQAFIDWFDRLAEEKGDHLLRIKGIVNVADEPLPYVVQCVQATRYSPERLRAWPDGDRRSRIVFITQDLPRSAIEPALQATQIPERAMENAPMDEGLPAMPSNPARSGKRWLNDAETLRLLGALASLGDDPAAVAIRLLLLTGISQDELRAARWEDVDLESGSLTIRGAGTAGRSARRVPLIEPAMLLLRELRTRAESVGLLGGTMPPDDAIATTWARALQDCGIETFGIRELAPRYLGALLDNLDQATLSRFVGGSAAS